MKMKCERDASRNGACAISPSCGQSRLRRAQIVYLNGNRKGKIQNDGHLHQTNYSAIVGDVETLK